jgi:hypothetical protein
VAAATAVQQALYQAVKGDPKLSGVPVYDLTGAAVPVSGAADIVNSHPYPTNGVAPGAYIQNEVTQTAAAEHATAQTPSVVTETDTILCHREMASMRMFRQNIHSIYF